MSRPARWVSALGPAVAGLLLLAAPSYAGGGLQQCLNQAIDHDGEPPTCTKVNGVWVASWPHGTGAGDGTGGGVPGVFVLFLVLGVLSVIGLTVWRVSTARGLATRSGMDPGLATRMTLLTDNGLDATYLAASLRPPAAAGPTVPTPVPRDASTRLTELKGLLDQGVVTQAEYDARRQTIIDSV